MPDCTLNIPYRSRDDSLADVGAAAHVLPQDERRVVRELVADAVGTPGVSTAGDLLNWFEEATPEQRRATVDRARTAAGLETVTEVERQRKAQGAKHSVGQQRDSAGLAFQSCAVDKCSATPINPTTGGPVAVAARRWHCAEHEHLAEPGDLEPWQPSLEWRANGWIDTEQERAEIARAKREEAALKRKAEARAAEVAAQAGEREHHEQARRQRALREAPDPIFRGMVP
jgi:hypothetical protein